MTALPLILLCLCVGIPLCTSYTTVGSAWPTPSSTTTTGPPGTTPPQCTVPCEAPVRTLKRLLSKNSTTPRAEKRHRPRSNPAQPASDGVCGAPVGSAIPHRSFEGYEHPCRPVVPTTYDVCRGHCMTSSRINPQSGLFTEKVCEEMCTPDTTEQLLVDYLCECPNGFCFLMQFQIMSAEACSCYLN